MKSSLWVLVLFLPLIFQFAEPIRAQDLPASSEAEPTADPDLQAIAVEAFNETFRREIQRLENEGAFQGAAVSDAEAGASAATRVSDSAVATPAPSSASTTRDLLSFLVGALDFGELSGGDGQNLVLALNPDLLDFGGGQGSGKATFREPSMFETLKLRLPEDVRESRELALLQGLSEFDDVEIVATWSKEGIRVGRDPQDYRPLTTSLATSLRTRRDRSALQALLRALDEGVDPETARLRGEEAGVATAKSLATLQAMSRASGFSRVGDLIANQPQFYVDTTGRFRDPLVGRVEYGVKINWEMGVANVNGLLKTCVPGQTLSRQQKLTAVPASCYTQFIEDHAADWSKRVALKVEYSKVDAYHHDLPDDEVSLDLDSAHTLRITGSLGFDLAPLPETGNSPPRVDFEAKYEDISDDEVRNDHRLFATLTYTQKMSPSSSTSLSLVYASKPEYLGEVDEEFSAHVGLKIKVDSKAATEGS